MRGDTTIPQNRGKVSVAMTMVSSLQNGVLYQSHSAAHRNIVGLLQILTPDQALRFLQWFVLNKSRCVKLFRLQQEKSESKGIDSVRNGDGSRSPCESGTMKTSDSLSDICKQLTGAFPKKPEESNDME